MGKDRHDVLDGREKTDASLGAERAGLDSSLDRSTANERRLFDDLIERDRLLADLRLMRFREDADQVLAAERTAGPPVRASVTEERRVADESKDAERAATDALLTRERGRVDARTDDRRREQDLERASCASQRRATDDRLSDERCEADVTSAALDRTRIGLANSQSDFASLVDVLAMVSHDLRSPLCVILSNAQMIAESALDQDTREAAQDMARAGARMNRILEDLLDVARLDSGTLRIVERRHDLGALLSEVLISYRPLFADRGLTLTARLPETPVLATFDHDRVVQVLSNLLTNALKFTPSPGTVELYAELEQGPDEVAFAVRDSGPGISPEVQSHVFERFWQGTCDTRRGLGLGLYICRMIAEAHGGRISVESRLGEGSTFRLSLPAG